MCLSSIFKEAFIKVYKSCNTTKGVYLPKTVQDKYVTTIIVSSGINNYL